MERVERTTPNPTLAATTELILWKLFIVRNITSRPLFEAGTLGEAKKFDIVVVVLCIARMNGVDLACSA